MCPTCNRPLWGQAHMILNLLLFVYLCHWANSVYVLGEILQTDTNAPAAHGLYSEISKRLLKKYNSIIDHFLLKLAIALYSHAHK